MFKISRTAKQKQFMVDKGKARKPHKPHRGYANFMACFIFCAGSGFTSGSISTNYSTGIMQRYANQVGGFDPSGHDSFNKAVMSSISTGFFLGTFLGTILTPYVQKFGGRKWSTVAYAALSLVFAVLNCIPVNYIYLIITRILLGIPSAMMMMICPMWVSEICDPKRRGIITLQFQLFGCLGIMISYVIAYALGPVGTQFIKNPLDNRWWVSPFLAVIAFAICTTIALILPETIIAPGQEETEMKTGSVEGSSAIDNQSTADGAAVESVASKAPAPKAEKVSLREVFTDRKYTRIMLLSLFLPLLQQGTGINPIIVYANSIMRGLPMPQASNVGGLAIGAWNLATNAIAVPMVDRVGRRFLLFGGTLLLMIALIIYIIVYLIPTTPSTQNTITGLLIFTTALYIFSFEVSSGPLMFTILAECMPSSSAKDQIYAIAYASFRIYTIIVTYTFPFMTDKMYSIFILYFLLTVITTTICWLCIPETKGYTLTEIEAIMLSGKVFEPFTLMGKLPAKRQKASA